MICAITGHTGLLGTCIVRKAENNVKFIKFKGNICNKKQISYWILNNNFDAFIHLAAIVPTKKVKRDYLRAKKVNFYGTKFIVDALKKKKKIYGFFIRQVHMFMPVQKNLLSEFLLLIFQF
jgi:dTDP-4-dehydrorhamnose reductase